jgi:hypothetical protein
MIRWDPNTSLVANFRLAAMSSSTSFWSISRPNRSISDVEQVDEPPRSNHACSKDLGSLAQCPIGRHQGDRTRDVSDDGEKHVVTAVGRMEDGDTANFAWLDTAASLPFEDHNNGFAE